MLKWERDRRLKYDAVTYEYDAAGIRQGKQTRTTTHTYYTEGTRIHRETRAHYANNYNLWYYYDQTGICAFECNGTMYHMRKNLQGDIVMLLDVNGNVAAKYVYDAWGNHKVLNPSNTEIRNDTFIGNINPFRYRGYYYDAETGLYYLNSRYYDPEIGRFINADSIDFAEPESLNGLNLYTYCYNNPVMFTDSTGCSWWLDALKVIGGAYLAVAGALFTIATLPIALVLPGGGFLTQSGFSATMYGAFTVGSVFNIQIQADMDAIGWNPFNNNEAATLGSSSVSFYKGMPVFRTSGSRSGSFLGIFLTGHATADTLRHEWGHGMQQGIMGAARYFDNDRSSFMAYVAFRQMEQLL